MKIISISSEEISIPKAHVIKGDKGKYFCLTHGENGRGRWQLQLPLAVREFPISSEKTTAIEMADNYELINLNKKDPRDNNIYLIVKGEEDGTYLVLLTVSSGIDGNVFYKVSGQAKIIGEGYESIGNKVVGLGITPIKISPCPLILVSGPCQINWRCMESLHDIETDYVASFDGSNWNSGPNYKCVAEEAAFNY